jgi:hypothetical protein
MQKVIVGVAVVRTDTKEIITHAGSDYQLVPHMQVLTAVESMLEANGLKYELFDIHTGGTKGNRMYVDYILPKYKVAVEGDKTIEQEMEELIETLDREQQTNKKDKKHGRHDGLK